MAGPNAPYTDLDSGQVLKQVFDESQDKLRVDAEVTATIASLEVEIDAADGDSIAISDGQKSATITSVGDHNALDVNIVNDSAGLIASSYFESISSVPSNSLTTILEYISNGFNKLQKIDVSGTNIAEYTVRLNGEVIDRKYTCYGSQLNLEFNFLSGIDLEMGDEVVIETEHRRPSLGQFNARIQVGET